MHRLSKIKYFPRIRRQSLKSLPDAVSIGKSPLHKEGKVLMSIPSTTQRCLTVKNNFDRIRFYLQHIQINRNFLKMLDHIHNDKKLFVVRKLVILFTSLLIKFKL